MVRVKEHYRSYEPKLDHGRSVERILYSIPREYLNGVEIILLRDEDSLTAAERRAGFARCKGIYVKAKGRRPARVELFVDNIYDGWPAWVTRVPVLRDEILYKILFHELAHHLQCVQLRRRRPSEDEAWQLAVDVSRRSFRRRHPALIPLAKLARWLLRALQRRKSPTGPEARGKPNLRSVAARAGSRSTSSSE